MSQLTVKVLQLGLLLLLWVFVLGVVGVLRRDLFGTRVVPRTSSPAPAPAPDRAPAPAPAPVPAAAPAPAPAPAPVRTPPPPPPPSGPRTLVVTEGPLAGTSLSLGASPVLIGRAPECTLVLPDDYASSRHARLAPDGDRWLLEDLGSTNGTTLGRSAPGTPVTGPVEVGAGAVVRIGRTTLELRR